MTRTRACLIALGVSAAVKVLALAGILVLAGCHIGHGPTDVESPLIPEVVHPPIADVDPTEPPRTAPRPAEDPDERLKRICDAKTLIDVGPANVAFTSYPCEVEKTRAAVEATEGKGFVMGFIPRFFLKARLVTRGVFSSVFGLFGIG